jgi:hypothetical protein
VELFLYVMDELSIRIETKCVLESTGTSVPTLKYRDSSSSGTTEICLLQHNNVTWKGERNVLKPHSEFFRNY